MSPDVDLNWAEVEASGLLTDAQDQDDRRRLIELLAREGVSMAEMVEAHRRGGLMRVAGDRSIRPGAGAFTLSAAAGELGADVEVVRRAWRSLGAVDPGVDVPVASVEDLALLRIALDLLEMFGERTGWALLRRYGALIERFTEATATAFIAELPNVSVVRSGSETDTAKAWNEVAGLVPRLGQLMDLTLRHHVESARRYLEGATASPSAAQSELVLGIGFADLSGYTARSQSLALTELAELLAEFERRAAEVISRLGGRIVKFVGDAVLFVSSEPDALAEMALAIVEPEGAEGEGLTARAGLTHGTVLARDGDYFGPVVNLAARLVTVAPSRSVVVSQDLRDALDPHRWDVEEQGPAELKGLDRPVVPYLLTARAT